MPLNLDSCITGIFVPGNIGASSGLPPIVRVMPPRLPITSIVAILESASATDLIDLNVMTVGIVEAAAAIDDIDTPTHNPIETVYITEAVTATDTPDAALPVAYATYDGLATNVVVSGGGRTVLHNTTLTNSGAISTAFESSGKYYFEVTLQTSTSPSDYLGIMSSAWSSVFSTTTMNANSTSVQLGTGTSPIISNGGSTGKSFGAAAVGDVYSAAIDLTAHLAWFRKNGGNWNNDAAADPATATGGVTIATGSFAPVVRFAAAAAATNQMTGNFGQAAFVYSVPSGFGNWPA